LRDVAGIDEPRRIVRTDRERILVSKFDPGFAARLHDALARLPELFDLEEVSREYRRLAALDSASTRVDTWHRAICELLARVATARSISGDQQAEIRAGIDSVAGLLAALLWSNPAVGDDRGPSGGEADALTDVLARMDADPGIFTRIYGSFQDRAVVNHCPGAPFARLFLLQGWTICATPIETPRRSQPVSSTD
jgi:hypothetical protein